MSGRRSVRKVEEEPVAPPQEEPVTTTIAEPIPEPTIPDEVKVMVKVGTLRWEGGIFEQGTTFVVSRKRALQMGNSVEILE